MTEGESSFPGAGRQLRVVAAFVAMAIALALLAGCTNPTHDESLLRTVKAESQRLVASYPVNPLKGWPVVPRSEWPPAIASLKPHSLTVYRWGLAITIKPYFDGGWGYDVPRGKRDLRMPAECYSEPGKGVFWHDPC